MPRQRMDDSFAGDFLFKVSLGGGSLAFGEPLMAKNEQTKFTEAASKMQNPQMSKYTYTRFRKAFLNKI